MELRLTAPHLHSTTDSLGFKGMYDVFHLCLTQEEALRFFSSGIVSVAATAAQ